jgi:glycosyltransferase involved in cell wall biosynthesis
MGELSASESCRTGLTPKASDLNTEASRRGRTCFRQCGGGSNSVLLLYVGRLSKEKNLPLLIDMMECLLASTRSHPSGARDYRLLVAGSGAARIVAGERKRAPCARSHSLSRPGH